MKETNPLRCTWLGLALAPLGLMAVLSGVVTLCVTERHAVVVWEADKRAKESISWSTAKTAATNNTGVLLGVEGVRVSSRGTVLPTKPGIMTVYYRQETEVHTGGEWSHTKTESHSDRLLLGAAGGPFWALDCDDFPEGECPLHAEAHTLVFTQYLSETKRVTYTYTPQPKTVSFAAVQRPDAHLIPWENPVNGDDMFLFEPNPSPGSSITSDLTGRVPFTVNLLRVAGWLTIWLGMYLMLSWVVEVAGSAAWLMRYCPWLARLSTVMIVVYASAAALLCALCVVVATWAIVQPSLVIPLVFCLIVVAGVAHRACSHRDYTQADFADDCISTDIESICTEERRRMRPPSPPLERAVDGYFISDVGDASCSSMLTLQ